MVVMVVIVVGIDSDSDCASNGTGGGFVEGDDSGSGEDARYPCWY